MDLHGEVFLYHRGRVSQLNLELAVSSNRLASLSDGFDLWSVGSANAEVERTD